MQNTLVAGQGGSSLHCSAFLLALCAWFPVQLTYCFILRFPFCFVPSLFLLVLHPLIPGYDLRYSSEV